MKIRVLHATKKTELGVVELQEDATVEDLNARIKQISSYRLQTAKIAHLRQRIQHDGKSFLFGKKIRDFVPTASEFEVTVKDLGPQLPYKTVRDHIYHSSSSLSTWVL